jgi:hypothetical protein
MREVTTTKTSTHYEADTPEDQALLDRCHELHARLGPTSTKHEFDPEFSEVVDGHWRAKKQPMDELLAVLGEIESRCSTHQVR